MSVKSSTNRFEYDAANAFATIASPQVITSSGASNNSIPVDVLTAYWMSGDVASLLDMAVVIEVSAVSGTNPTATFAVQVAPDSGAFSAPVAVGASIAVTGAGRSVLVVDRSDIATALNGATVGSMRLYATLGGTSPSFTFYAYPAPLTGL